MNWWILQGTHGGLNIRDVRFDTLGGKFKRLVEPALCWQWHQQPSVAYESVTFGNRVRMYVLVRYEVSLRERISTTSIIQIYIHFRATLPIPGDSMHCTRGLEGTHRISRWGVDVDVLVHGLPVRFLIWPAQREDLSNSYPAWDILGTDWPHEFGNGRNHGNWWSTMRFISRQDFDMLLGRIISFLLQPIHWAQNNLQQFFIITKLNWSHAPRLENGTEFLRPSDGGPQLYPTCQFCFTASRITSLSAINSGLRYDIPWPYRSNESACESACHLLRLKWGYPQIIPNYIDIYKPF